MSLILLIVGILLIKVGIQYDNSNLYWTASIFFIIALIMSLIDIAALLRWIDKLKGLNQ